MNKKLVSEGKEPLYAIYPVDGVSISDSPFGYIDNKNSKSSSIPPAGPLFSEKPPQSLIFIELELELFGFVLFSLGF